MKGKTTVRNLLYRGNSLRAFQDSIMAVLYFYKDTGTATGRNKLMLTLNHVMKLKREEVQMVSNDYSWQANCFPQYYQDIPVF